MTALGLYLTITSDRDIEEIITPLTVTGFVLAFVSLFFLLHFWIKSRLLKSVIKGRDNLQESLRMIRDLNESPKEAQHIEHGIKALSEICQQFSKGMRQFHEDGIAISIHYINQAKEDGENSRPYVKILCRNLESSNRNLKRYKYGAEKDYIDSNTDFGKIIQKLDYLPSDKVCYTNNFLPFSPFYQNTHFSERDMKRFYRWYGIIFRIAYWPLSYKSTMTVPIIYYPDNNNGNHVGFLSVDSPRLWAFSRSLDLPILKHFANHISPIIAMYVESNLLPK